MTGSIITPSLEPAARAVARTAGLLWEKGWAERNAGNVSVDVTGSATAEDGAFVAYPVPSAVLAGRTYLVKATGARFRDIAADPGSHMVLATVAQDLSGYSVSASIRSLTCTSEFPAHLRVHAMLREAGRPERAVLHTHPTALIALSHSPSICDAGWLNAVLFAMHPEVKVFLSEGVALAPYSTPGSDELAIASSAALKGRKLVLWEKHGCVAVGRGPEDAFDLIDTADKAAVIYLACKSAGFEPSGLTREQIDGLSGFSSR